VTGDLERLIAAVDAGGWPDRRTEVAAFYSGGSITHCNECAGLARQAYNGSLDAALRLHEALLPGWQINMAMLPVGPDTVCAIYGPLEPTASKWAFAPKHEARAANPARAWLLSILRALAKREEG
jgi:hypothetical protein